MERICKNCRWHNNFTWVCFNEDSEYKTDMTDNNFECEVFEMRNEEEFTIDFENNEEQVYMDNTSYDKTGDEEQDYCLEHSWQEKLEILQEIKDYCESSGSCKYCDFLNKNSKCVFKDGLEPEHWNFDEWRGDREDDENFFVED